MSKRTTIAVFQMALLLLFLPILPRPVAAQDVGSLLAGIDQVGPEGQGSVEAAAAWRELSQLGEEPLPEMLAALDDAEPLAANWIRTAIDAICERQMEADGLAVGPLNRFLANRSHAPRARRLAYEWILKAEPAMKNQLLASMLDDPSVELRREAVARLTENADQLLADEKTEDAIAVYQAAFAASRDLDQVKSLYEKLGELEVEVDVSRHLGFLMRWQIVGPFDNSDETGFDVAYPPELGVDLKATYQGKTGPVRWVAHTTEDDYGRVDLNELLGKEKAVCGYAMAEFLCDKEQDVEIRLGAYTAMKVWVNGDLVTAPNIYHAGSFLDQYTAKAVLKPGRNVILIKVCQNEQMQNWAEFWEFQLRVCDAIGGGVLSTDRD